MSLRCSFGFHDPLPYYDNPNRERTFTFESILETCKRCNMIRYVILGMCSLNQGKWNIPDKSDELELKRREIGFLCNWDEDKMREMRNKF